MYDLRELSYSAFSEKIMTLAEENKVDAKTMIGACLMILRGLYTILPPELQQDFADSMHRFINELEAGR